ncbi:conserved protein of unknown function [Pseudodesulfovibrio profundus]|uniref:pEK499-p136 HEPN domain-containing protein n=1 Tax=Pseudodesulfovibrio profundus TaxID=57320 RepID=A0A2C8F475_9BACT|nr:HEPN family nuclease [Pseudodesulfovibrio profundus]SOB57194.1 conserved protein of unknown function [Pseudodesulfovibrio profundus]
MGMYEGLLRDFAVRTKANLEYIDEAWELQEREGLEDRRVFNVTQLINSCLGMVVFMSENGIAPNIPIQEFCPEMKFITRLDVRNSNRNLNAFLKRFRNAISHCHIEAYGTETDIEGFNLWDGPPNGAINWRIEMNTASIRALALALVGLVEDNYPPNPRR